MTLATRSEQKAFGGIQGVYRHQSRATQCEMEFSLYLPQMALSHKRPVVFYLSGLTCTQENATTKAGFQRIPNQLGLIVVCPDTSPRGTDYPEEHASYDFGSGAGFYLNATQPPWSQSYRMYDYIVDELPELIREHFPVAPAPFAIMGHSMGGHGALTIGLKNPEQYCSISAFAPITAPTQCPWGQKAFHGYLGDNQDDWASYDATRLIEAGYRSNNKILIEQGTDDQFLEQQLKPEIFYQACQNNDQPVELRMQDGYDHSYYLMSTFMQDHLQFHARNLGLL